MTSTEKKLYRSSKEKMLFGVCGGLAEYFSVDPTLVRLAACLLIMAPGIGLFTYLLFALVMPSEEKCKAAENN